MNYSSKTFRETNEMMLDYILRGEMLSDPSTRSCVGREWLPKRKLKLSLCVSGHGPELNFPWK